MHIQEIRGIARDFGLKTSRQSKVKLVRQIQHKEGNFDCFATAINGFCDQYDCRWREDCFDLAKKTAH